MKVCDLYTGGSQLKRAGKTLKEKWNIAKEHWNDQNRREFEDKYLHPILPEITQSLAALYEFSELLEQAE